MAKIHGQHHVLDDRQRWQHLEELKDAKTLLQEWLQGRGLPLPEYILLREEGADHAKKFYVQCRIVDDDNVMEACGNSRRKAEQAVAAIALEYLKKSVEV